MFDSIHWHVYGLKGIVDEIKGFGIIGNIIEDMGLTPADVKSVAIITFAVLIIAAYFIGNISPSTIMAKRRGLDIKKEGSGNAGTTNALRVMGKKAGVTTLVIDVMKGVAAVVLAEIIAGEGCGMLCAVAVIVGHVWPVIYKFKGGKGVATTFGALVAINPLLGLWTLLVVAVVTYLSKRMSAGSIAGAICFPIICLFNEPEFIVWGSVLAVIVLVKHRANIVRLLDGEEPKLGFLDKDKKAEAEKEGSVVPAEAEIPAAEPAEELEAAETETEEDDASEQPAAADEPVAEENEASDEQMTPEEQEEASEEQPEKTEEKTADENAVSDTPEADDENADGAKADQPENETVKTEKYKRPVQDKNVKKNGKKKKTYPNKKKNGGQNKNGGQKKGNNTSKGKGNNGKSKKKGGKKK